MSDYVAVVPLFVRFITNYSQYKVFLKRLRYVPFVQKPAHCKHSLTFFQPPPSILNITIKLFNTPHHCDLFQVS